MSGPYVLGIDFGTESVRVGIFDQAGAPLVFASQAYPLYHPQPGWAEQRPDEWWSAFVVATRQAMAESGIAKEEIVGLGADCTSCTVVALDEASGRSVRPSSGWTCARRTRPGASRPPATAP